MPWGEEAFDEEWSKIKEDPSTLRFFAGTPRECYYPYSDGVKEAAIALEKAILELHLQYEMLDQSAKKAVLESYLIEDLRANNAIEGIASSRDDLFYLLHKGSPKAELKRFQSSVRAYALLSEGRLKAPSSPSDVRVLYDLLLQGAVTKEDRIEGPLFREGPVSVVGSTEPVHAGFAPDQIEAGLQDALSALRAKGLFGSERFLLFHYLLEDIHPFYDGNGRLGRFLLSLGFQNEAESPFAFLVSRSIEEKKGVYYQAFREAEKAHNFADLTAFVEPMLLLLQEGAAKAVGELKTKRAAFEKEKERLGALRGGAKRKVAILLLEASFYSAFGISNEEILSETKISRRALQYALKEFREEGMLLEKKIGKTTYQKLRLAEEG